MRHTYTVQYIIHAVHTQGKVKYITYCTNKQRYSGKTCAHNWLVVKITFSSSTLVWDCELTTSYRTSVLLSRPISPVELENEAIWGNSAWVTLPVTGIRVRQKIINLIVFCWRSSASSGKKHQHCWSSSSAFVSYYERCQKWPLALLPWGLTCLYILYVLCAHVHENITVV